MPKAAALLSQGEHITLTHAPDGLDALAVADVARALAQKAFDRVAAVVHVARDAGRMDAMERALRFFAPELDVLSFPAWDCLPYDRVSPNAAVSARRMTTLARLARTTQGDRARVVLTTVNAVVQRVAARDLMAAQSLSMAPGNSVDLKELTAWLEINGFQRSGTVRDTGEYAVRGGILDLFPPATGVPVRLDFFGDTLESIRAFDAETQRTTGQMKSLDLVPVSEVLLTTETMRRFRQNYAAQFGAPSPSDALYSAVSEGRRYPGVEHWLPLFHPTLDTLFDYMPDAALVLDPLADAAVAERFSQIDDYYAARRENMTGAGGVYKPLKPEQLYLTPEELKAQLSARGVARVMSGDVFSSTPTLPSPCEGEGSSMQPSSFNDDPKTVMQGNPLPFTRGGLGRGSNKETSSSIIDLGGRPGRNFSFERADPKVNVFDAAVAHLDEVVASGKRAIVAAWSDGARERLGTVLADHGLENIQTANTFAQVEALPKGKIAIVLLGLEAGFETNAFIVLGEQDILGDRLVRQRKKSKRAANFLTEVTGLSAGDLVVHVDHGIGRFHDLKAIEAAGAPHDCLEIHYANGDKLFLPVENIELLTRYGSEDTEAVLDKLGGAGWQNRKAKLKQRIREMAGELINIAAARMTREAPRFTMPDGVYDEFCARFPYDETEDQQNAIDAVLDDLTAGRPMDRLVCGDVGFGKTEVALRAAFATALAGKQVAVVVPTTLLARQHYKTFADRFHGLPVRVAQASRFVPAAEMKLVKEGLASGSVDVVVGTHALLGKSIHFKDLGLVIVDEEQHFGVAHKERLKALRAEVHVLTLSATPIPRTLQLALTGVRELSIIATPPVDRLAVRTFVTPFDPLVVREALLRERYRGGQSFYVCPRVEHLADVREFLATQVPEVKVGVAHGQMSASELEDVMTAFYEGQYDVLLATTIVESGLDIPRANTLIVHRADMFGLAQLYQLRGRVGRAKLRAYALFTVPDGKPMTVNAQRRLDVLQSLDSLGAGFQLASHDLDIRGAGNLLGDEQSGHIREVGYELYQQMLQDAIANLKEGGGVEVNNEQWSPQIQMGTPVLIPEDYVEDLHLRLGLYRRLAELDSDEGINSFAAELTDRFGPMPEEVEHLLQVMTVKTLCRRANVDKIDAGPKGAVVSFRDNLFANPDGLVHYLARDAGEAKLRPDMRVVFKREWATPQARLKGTAAILRQLVRIADLKKAA